MQMSIVHRFTKPLTHVTDVDDTTPAPPESPNDVPSLKDNDGDDDDTEDDDANDADTDGGVAPAGMMVAILDDGVLF